jgi:DNA-binding CsgD family transcriptional regulator
MQSETSAKLSSLTITLDESEKQLLRLICAEKSNAELATALNISKKTVERYLSLLYIKLGVQGRVGAAVWFGQYDNLQSQPSED